MWSKVVRHVAKRVVPDWPTVIKSWANNGGSCVELHEEAVALLGWKKESKRGESE
jgi:hypothetical protein